MDLEGTHDSWLEVQHLWVDLHWGDCATGEDYVSKLGEDRLGGQTCIETVELE